MFQKATKVKLRFNSGRGLLSVEDLWDLPIDGELSINSLYIDVNNQLKAESTEGLISKKTNNCDALELRLEILKSIYEVKLQEQKDAEQSVYKASQRQKILSIISNKQDTKLTESTVEELETMLKKLG